MAEPGCTEPLYGCYIEEVNAMQHPSTTANHCRPEKQQVAADLLEAVALQGCALAGLLSSQAGLLQWQSPGGELDDTEEGFWTRMAADPREALAGEQVFQRESPVRRMVNAVCRLEILQQMKLELFSPKTQEQDLF